jgi:hypothetical protein
VILNAQEIQKPRNRRQESL